MPPTIDLRSDTVSRPTPAMRQVMAQAEVGDDVLGDDPTVLNLQSHVARIMGKPAACFVPSGTMANQVAIRAHTEPGDELLAHRDSHIIHYETGAPAALSGVMIAPLDGPDGQFDADDVRAAVRPRSSHFACSKLLVVENTHNRGGGSIWPLDKIARVTAVARELGLHTHLDGARIWNACATTGIDPAEYARHFDSVYCCFSKGLGAPAGSAVCGNPDFIARVHRFRKMFGGAMRQAGILAAACRYALDHHRARLTDDHRNARALAAGASSINGLSVINPVESNMVFIRIDPRLGTAADFARSLEVHAVRALPNRPDVLRAVCHIDVDADMISRAIEALRACATQAPAATMPAAGLKPVRS